MTLYARSDLMAVAIPQVSGGCGQTHTRPVTQGAPSRTFQLDCPPCEAYLSGANRPQILKYELDPKTRAVIGQRRVADADPQWSSTPDTIPPTPDEQRIGTVRAERGALQIQMLQALAAIRATGVDVPSDALYLLERDLPAGVLKGTVVCANGHDNLAGLKFCGECGIRMDAKGEIGNGAHLDVDDIPLDRLHIATLRKKCREKGVPDKGTKLQLISRLS
jgi:hypothetical protein